MTLLNLEAVVATQVWEGLTTDQFFGAVGWHPFEFSNLGPDPGAFLLEDLCHPLILQVLRDPYLQIRANDVQPSSSPDGSHHFHPQTQDLLWNSSHLKCLLPRSMNRSVTASTRDLSPKG